MGLPTPTRFQIAAALTCFYWWASPFFNHHTRAPKYMWAIINWLLPPVKGSGPPPPPASNFIWWF